MILQCQEKLKPSQVTVCTNEASKDYQLIGALHIGFKINLECMGSGINKAELEVSFVDGLAIEFDDIYDEVKIKNFKTSSEVNLEKLPIFITSAVVDLDEKTIKLY
jgi:hypothetical protein